MLKIHPVNFLRLLIRVIGGRVMTGPYFVYMKKKHQHTFFSPRYIMGLVFGISIMSIFSLGVGTLFFALLLGICISLCLLFFGKE